MIKKAQLKDLEKKISEGVKAAVTDVLRNEVFELVKTVVLDRVQTDVYDVYEPTVYRRRKDDQGLLDEENVVYEIKDNGTLAVWNTAKYNPYRDGRPIYSSFSKEKRKDNILQTLVIDGYANYSGDAPYAQPRPFIANADADISQGGKHRRDLDEAFEMGLKKHGIRKRK